MSIQVFGITGTNGKTTASCMLRNILNADGKTCGLIGTIEHQAGEKTYTPINTTPGADLLKELFHEMKQEGIEYCAMEISSHGIHQGRTEAIQIMHGGFTNLSQDHLDYHKTMENYFQVKKKLFFQCRESAVINLDDGYGKRLCEELSKERPSLEVVTYSLKDRSADLLGKVEASSISGTRVCIIEKGEKIGKIKIPIPGRHFVYNGLQAVGLARKAGVGFAAIKSGIENAKAIPGRMEVTGDENEILGIVDYAHTPDGLEKLLTTAEELKKGRLICVFGCGGFRDRGKRKIMGDIAGTHADYCIITSDNPRGEPPENISQEIEEGIYPTGCDYCVLLDRYQAIKRAVTLATKWDIIIVAGKGHEKYQLIGDKKLPFDDMLVLKKLLEKKHEGTYY